MKPTDLSDDQLVTAIRNALGGKGSIEGVETILAEVRRRHRALLPKTGATVSTGAHIPRRDTWDKRFAAPKKGTRK